MRLASEVDADAPAVAAEKFNGGAAECDIVRKRRALAVGWRTTERAVDGASGPSVPMDGASKARMVQVGCLAGCAAHDSADPTSIEVGGAASHYTPTSKSLPGHQHQA